jgi:HSP20 family protein
MASVIRWAPIRELDGMCNAMDRLYEEGFPGPLTRARWDVPSAPGMDLYQTDEAVVIKMGLPGVEPGDIQVSVTYGVLTVRGEVKEEKEEKEKTYHLRERRFGSFSRSVKLPSNVNVEKSDAQFENGVLTLTLPKAEEAKPRTIAVKTKK